MALIAAGCGGSAPSPGAVGSTPTSGPAPEADPDPEASAAVSAHECAEAAGAEAEAEADPEPEETPAEAQAEPDPEADPEATGGAAGAAAGQGEGELVVYSGRNQELIGPIIECFEEESGMEVDVRYQDTAELAATILEEGENSPADVYIAQDAGALGAVAEEGRLQKLEDEILDRVPEQFRSPDGLWVGLSGRARVVAYNTEAVQEGDLPEGIEGFTDERWKGRKIGWAPTNGSFQAFVTAFRLAKGEDAAREWLEGVQANEPVQFESNDAILQAVVSGEIEVGFVNHYYLLRALEEEGEDVAAKNYYLEDGDPGALVNVAGAGILEGAEHAEQAEELLEYLLSEEGQEYFARETFEYPLVEGVETDPRLPPLDEIGSPDIDLSRLRDLEGTTRLLTETGVI